MTNPQRRNALKTIGAGAALALGGIGTATARKGKRKGASGDESITEIAAGDERFSTLVAALEETGLDVVLDSDEGQSTVFAPTNTAFENLAEELDKENVEDLLALENLENILRYHVTSGRRYSESVVNAPRIRMLNGEDVDVDTTVLNDGQAGIVETNIEAMNGVIHVIDGDDVDGAGVLLP